MDQFHPRKEHRALHLSKTCLRVRCPRASGCDPRMRQFRTKAQGRARESAALFLIGNFRRCGDVIVLDRHQHGNQDDNLTPWQDGYFPHLPSAASVFSPLAIVAELSPGQPPCQQLPMPPAARALATPDTPALPDRFLARWRARSPDRPSRVRRFGGPSGSASCLANRCGMAAPAGSCEWIAHGRQARRQCALLTTAGSHPHPHHAPVLLPHAPVWSPRARARDPVRPAPG